MQDTGTADILGQMQGTPLNAGPPRMSPTAFNALSQGFAPTMPGMTPQDRMNMQRDIDNQSNAFRARNIIPGAQDIMPQGFTPPEQPLPESTFAGGREYQNPQGPPMPLPMRFEQNVNAMARGVQDLYNAPDFRAAAYPYLQRMGLAR